MRSSWILLLALTLGCAPTREAPDDPVGTPPDDAAQVYDELEPGSCVARWDDDDDGWMGDGGGWMTTGLWYELSCDDPDGARLSLNLQNLDPAPGTEAPVIEINAWKADGSHAWLDSPGSALHIEEGDWSDVGGWWEGEAQLDSESADRPVLRAVVFKRLPMEVVVGR